MKKIYTFIFLTLLVFLTTSCEGFLSFRKYQVSFETNLGTPLEPVEVEIGLPIDFSNIVTTRENYIFIGWYLDSKLENKIDDDYLVFANILLYAKWELDVISHPNVSYAVESSTLSWEFGQEQTFQIYLNNILFTTTNVNNIDLSSFNETLTEETLLEIIYEDINDNTLNKILSINIKYEQMEILFEEEFSKSSGFDIVNLTKDEPILVNDWEITNSNFVTQRERESIKLINNNNNNLASQISTNISVVDNIYKKIVINGRSEALNELNITVIDSNNDQVLFNNNYIFSTNFSTIEIDFAEAVTTDFEIIFKLVPSVLNSNNSGINISNISLLGNDYIYKIN